MHDDFGVLPVETTRTATRRLKTIGTKVTVEEYGRLVALADGRRVGEWVRDVLLQVATPRPADHMLLGEMLALRTIVLNLVFALASGETPTPDVMRRLIDRADEEKSRRALERLAAGPRNR